MSEIDMPFSDLFEGKRDRMLISVQVTATGAGHACPDGVYELTHPEFVQICQGISDQSREIAVRTKQSDRIMTPHFVAAMCDTDGLGDRWFRLSPPVAAWIRSKSPVVTVNAFIA